jgi:hypothetical protein
MKRMPPRTLKLRVLDSTNDFFVLLYVVGHTLAYIDVLHVTFKALTTEQHLNKNKNHEPITFVVVFLASPTLPVNSSERSVNN